MSDNKAIVPHISARRVNPENVIITMPEDVGKNYYGRSVADTWLELLDHMKITAKEMATQVNAIIVDLDTDQQQARQRVKDDVRQKRRQLMKRKGRL